MATVNVEPNKSEMPPAEPSGGGEMGEWFKSNFDKILMTVIFAAMLAVYVHVMHHSTDQSATVWLQQKTGEVLASILTLTAARALMGAKNGVPPTK